MTSGSIYRTGQGEMLDAICRRRYGSEHGTVEAVLNANPGLAALGVVLPTGIEIVLPDLPSPKAQIKGSVNLWD